MNKNAKLAGAIAAAMLLPAFGSTAMASTYVADSDTGITALDYIENNHRRERENRLTEEQKKLLADVEAFRKSLQYLLDKKKAYPIAFEGEDLTYDERDGSFVAKGKVDIVQLDAHRFQGELVTGNTMTEDVHVPDKAHVLQMTPGQSRVTLDGYRVHYNYGKQTGTMEDGKGKAGSHYVTGKRFEFYPDKIIVYNGTDTKCGAQKPDYHMAAEKMVIYPNDKVVMDKVRFCIKGKTIFTRDHYEASLQSDGKDDPWPRMGYNSTDKFWVAWSQAKGVRKNVVFHANYKLTGAAGWRSNFDITWSNRGMSTGVRYGYFQDSNDNWIKKQPSYFWNYGRRLGHTHFRYSLGVEHGEWYSSSRGIHSDHTQYSFGLSYDPIRFNRYTLYLSTGYNITKESYNGSKVNGFNADAVLTKDFDERWAAYVGYHYNKQNSRNSLFDFNLDSFSRKLESGFSYRIDKNNRVAVGTRYDIDNGEWRNVDYYWYHDMHCSQAILRYQSKARTWSVRWEFTPW